MESIKELRKICQTKKQPLYMELFSMKISIYITKLLLYTRISADHVTMSMMMLTVLGSILMGFGDLWVMLAGILAIHFTIILDNVNGEVARYRKEDGIIGTFLEQVYHNLATPLVFFSLSYGVFLAAGNPAVLVFGFLAAVFGRPIVLDSIKDAVVDERLGEIQKKRKVKGLSTGAKNMKGGSSGIGNRLYESYETVRQFWVFPAYIVHITLLVIAEIVNLSYGFFDQYLLLSSYIYAYGGISLLIQFAAFIVNYRGRAVDHYYRTLFGRK